MNCPNCGTPLAEGENFCPSCGNPASNGADCGANAAYSSPSRRTTICPKCETKNPEGSAVCAICGEVLPIIPVQQPVNPHHNNDKNKVFCNHCGAPNVPSASVCKQCGKSLFSGSVHTDDDHDIPYPRPTHHDKTFNGILIALIISVIAVCGAIIFILLNPGDDDESIDETPMPTVSASTPTYEPVETDYPPTPTPTILTPPPTRQPEPTHNERPAYISYNTYSDSEFAMSCPYPKNFSAVTPESNFIKRSLVSNSDDGHIYICSTINDNGRDASKVSANFKNSYSYNTVLSENISDYVCSTLITDGYTYHYCYYTLYDGMIRGFEMKYTEPYKDLYSSYASHMRTNIVLY